MLCFTLVINLFRFSKLLIVHGFEHRLYFPSSPACFPFRKQMGLWSDPGKVTTQNSQHARISTLSDIEKVRLIFFTVWFLFRCASISWFQVVSESVIDVFRLAHLRVFQSYLFLSRHQCPLSQRPKSINFDGGGLSGEIEGLGGERFPK